MADTDTTSEAPSAIKVGGASVPSQITINIGGQSATGQADMSAYALKSDIPAAPDLSGLVTSASLVETLKGFTKSTQTAAIADSIRATRATAEETAARAKEAADGIQATLAAAVDLFRQPRVLRLDVGAPVPADTPRGALIFRTDKPLSTSQTEFPPLNEWPLIDVSANKDGFHLSGTGGVVTPDVTQMKPSDGKWEITMSYSWHGNFEEPETVVYVYNCRTFEEFGKVKIDQGAKLQNWTIKAGDRVTAKLIVTPKDDEHATALWAPSIEAPGNGFVIHDLSVRKVA